MFVGGEKNNKSHLRNPVEFKIIKHMLKCKRKQRRMKKKEVKETSDQLQLLIILIVDLIERWDDKRIKCIREED